MSIFSFRRKGKRPRRGDGDAPNDAPTPIPRTQTFPPPAHGNSSTFLNRRDSKRRKHESVQADIGNGASAPAAPPRLDGPARTPQSHSDLNNQTLRQPISTDTFPPYGRLAHNRSEVSIDESRFPAPSIVVRKNKGRGLLRRKSTRRKQSDQAREQQIREMSSFNGSSAGLPNRLSVDAPPSSRAFRVGAFDAWTPRPRLRCTETSFQTPAASRNPSSSSTARDKLPAGPFVPTDPIATLADAMDSRDLRQLLERDQRRTLRDRGAEAFINQRLQQEDTRPKPEADAGQPMATSNNNSGSWLEDPSKENLAAPKGLSSGDAQTMAPLPRQKPPVDAKTAVPNASHLPPTPAMSTSDLSRSLHNEKRNNSVHLARSLAGIFRRASSRLKRRPEPIQSSFSIPSRDSVAKPPSAQATQARDIPKKTVLRHAAASNHSRSRFTEHLNDISDSTPVPGPLGMVDDPYAPSQRVSTVDRYSVSFVSTTDIRDERGTRANSPDGNTDALMMAQSLASIDSEASWLSGKPSRRLSQKHRNNLRKSASSTKERLDESAESAEYDESAEDNIFGQFSILEEESEQTGGSRSSELSPLSARPDSGAINPETETFHASVGKRPVLVRPKSRAKSTEGLFTAYQESIVEPGTPEPPETHPEDAYVERATSIDFGKGHVRHISAGSAKLLDLSSPRAVEQNSDSEMKTNIAAKEDEGK